jgi:hypothetical protein
MEAAYFIIAILGCGEGEMPCEQVRVADARYESQAACVAATEGTLMRNTDLDFPVVVAQCLRGGEELPERIMPGDVDLPAAPAASRT